MYTLGINAVYHDPAACLVRDGGVIAAAEEDDLHTSNMGNGQSPFQPMNCLSMPSTTVCERPE